MTRVRLLSCLITLLACGLAGCGSEDTQAPSEPTPPPEICAAPNRVVGDSCVPPGIPVGDCGEGFVHDGVDGCEPVLPAAACADGLMAVPGDEACLPVMVCGEGPWGDIPVDDDTVFVDGDYAGGSSDGSAAMPFTTIGSAVAAAAEGALIAVGAGTYAEDVELSKPVRLWGICPERVAIVGVGDSIGAVDIRVGASGAEVRGLAITGDNAVAVFVSGAENVTLAQLWVHDTAARAISVENSLGPTSFSVERVLVERSLDAGLFVGGSAASLEQLAVRDILPSASDQSHGHGIDLVAGADGTPAVVTLSESLIERSHDAGLLVAGAEATLEGVVVRDVFPQASDDFGGRGLVVQIDPVTGALARFTGTHLLVERTHAFGLFIAGSQAHLENVVVRDIEPRQSDQTAGHGIHVQPDFITGIQGSARVVSTVVARTHDLGIFAGASEADFEGLVVRDTRPRAFDQGGGRGMSIQYNPETGAAASARLSASLVERSHDIGIFVGATQATIDRVVVRETALRQSDGLFGDGFAIIGSDATSASVSITDSVSRDNARAGLSNFGSMVSIAGSALTCNAFELAGEAQFGRDFSFDDLGGNSCGCPTATAACKAISAGLAPPEPLP
jgi:Protein of unknown function (DUF1565)